MRHRVLPRLALLAAIAALAIACGQRVAVVPGPAMPARDSVVISDSPYGAYVGSPISLDARVWRDGVVDPAAPVQWSASPAAVARVAADGTLTPLGEGHVTVTARAGKSRTTRTLLVRRNPERRVGFVTPSRDDQHRRE